MPWKPSSMMSWASAGRSTDIPISAMAASELLGTVEDSAMESLGDFPTLVAHATAVGRRHPHLTETVVAFAQSDMQIARSALAMRLPADTVAHRLERWAALTGDGIRGGSTH
ncbi:hypothetical protein [Streptomyces sp. NPDC050263]|uniref:hypothetical protein n=1 Tax=Streptomyces sp. NPDC050263 TaxID=3155037 RepID=UPI00341466A9